MMRDADAKIAADYARFAADYARCARLSQASAIVATMERCGDESRWENERTQILWVHALRCLLLACS